jgi:transcription antitermination factor NusG
MIRTRELARLEEVLSQQPEILARFAPGATSAEIPTLRWIDQEMSRGEAQTCAWPAERVEVPFRPGDTVRTVSGPFGNTPAAFVEAVPDTTRIRVQVRVFGRSAITEVELADVELPAR